MDTIIHSIRNKEGKEIKMKKKKLGLVAYVQHGVLWAVQYSVSVDLEGKGTINSSESSANQEYISNGLIEGK